MPQWSYEEPPQSAWSAAGPHRSSPLMSCKDRHILVRHSKNVFFPQLNNYHTWSVLLLSDSVKYRLISLYFTINGSVLQKCQFQHQEESSHWSDNHWCYFYQEQSTTSITLLSFPATDCLWKRPSPIFTTLTSSDRKERVLLSVYSNSRWAFTLS